MKIVKLTENTTMRDAFFSRLFELAKENRDLIVIAADQGAPSLDKFRAELSGQFIEAGIAEQNALLVAAGLAHSGKKTYVYAIAPFVSTRIHEFIKIEAGLMKLPIRLIAVGTGYGYDDSGPTHHTVEDISITSPIPNLEVHSPSDSFMAADCADITAESNNPIYLRLDRKTQRIKYANFTHRDFSAGYNIFQGSASKKGLCLVATGNIVDMALDIKKLLMDEMGQDIDVIDIYRLNPINEKLKDALSMYKWIVSIEEHLLRGGLGSIISEIITDNNLPVKLRRVGVSAYNYEYGGRAHIQAKMGIGQEAVMKVINALVLNQ